MAPRTATPIARRTQEERTSAMRHRLLEATIDCLVEYGYAGTSTTRVVERAGVTRGAQVHHFPTKAALVAAAIRHLAAKRGELAFAELERIRNEPDPVGSALDLLWDLHQGRSSTPPSSCGSRRAPIPSCTANCRLWSRRRPRASSRWPRRSFPGHAPADLRPLGLHGDGHHPRDPVDVVRL
jgi:AcrR family transcriptional regulator